MTAAQRKDVPRHGSLPPPPAPPAAEPPPQEKAVVELEPGRNARLPFGEPPQPSNVRGNIGAVREAQISTAVSPEEHASIKIGAVGERTTMSKYLVMCHHFFQEQKNARKGA